jgi:hypothetical protein
VFIGVVEGVVGRDIEEVGFLGRIGGEQGSWREDKENLTYGRKRVFNAAICFSISPKPLCAAAEPGLACLTSMLEAVACQNLVRGLRLSISRFFDGGLKLKKLAGEGNGEIVHQPQLLLRARSSSYCVAGVNSCVVGYCGELLSLDQGLFIVARRSSPPTVSRDLMK